VDDPDLENDDYKTHFNLDEKFRSEWRPRHSGFAQHGRPPSGCEVKAQAMARADETKV
jgi:hypothetical protein